MRVVGLDVGGANLKGCGLTLTPKSTLTEIIFETKHFQVWLHDRESLWNLVAELVSNLSGDSTPDLVSIVMTAELSDAFQTKREGVNTIVDGITKTLESYEVVYPDVDLTLLSPIEAKASPQSVAAANWPVLAWMIGQMISDCILIDVGSTTTDIIPVRNGVPSTIGKNDTNRLIHGELVYTGALRTDLSAIARSVNLDGTRCRVSSEYFATSADIHRILGNITEEEYIIDTADGRGKDRENCMARVARLVCGDSDSLTEAQIIDIANQVWDLQVKDISDGLMQVIEEHRLDIHEEQIVLSGLGSGFLGMIASTRIGAMKITYLTEILGIDERVPATAYAAAVFAGMMRDKNL
ncbi:MAG: hydantoinase/oxoprolinase family protein [Candidatus Thorarchaeota archaeon]|jgi:probable H4MPT-linked C1 transfer pathway protein